MLLSIHSLIKDTLDVKCLFLLNPNMVEPIIDGANNYFLKFYFKDGKTSIIPKENIIYLRRYFCENNIFGGTGSRSNHEALLRTLMSNDAFLLGVEKAVFSSFKIKGILKLNAILKVEDKKKALDNFNKILTSSNYKSSIIPLDFKKRISAHYRLIS